MPSRTPITRHHLELLRRFGRSQVQKKLPTKKQKQELWKLTCETAGVAHVPYEDMVDEWRRTVTGDSSQTNIAVGSTVDPDYVTLAVCYQGKSIGAHTVKLGKILTRLLRLHSENFQDPDAFIDSVRKMTHKADSRRRKRNP